VSGLWFDYTLRASCYDFRMSDGVFGLVNLSICCWKSCCTASGAVYSNSPSIAIDVTLSFVFLLRNHCLSAPANLSILRAVVCPRILPSNEHNLSASQDAFLTTNCISYIIGRPEGYRDTASFQLSLFDRCLVLHIMTEVPIWL